MKKLIFGIIAAMVVIAGGVSCLSGNAGVKQEQTPTDVADNDSTVANDNVSDSTAIFEVSDSVEVGKERLSVLKKSVGAHGYREFYIERGEEYGCHFKVFDSRITEVEIVLSLGILQHLIRCTQIDDFQSECVHSRKI